jgi:hypothetical protein
MNAIALIGFILCTVALVRVTLARAEMSAGATPASAKELTRLRTHVNAVREHKCLRAIPIVARAASLTPRWRAVVFRRWQVRHRAAHSRSKACAMHYDRRAAVVAPWRSWLASVRSCESGGNYGTNTGNGFYGAYQFVLSTWHSVGGHGYPHQNSPLEQDYRAVLLRLRSGTSPWPVCG